LAKALRIKYTPDFLGKQLDLHLAP